MNCLTGFPGCFSARTFREPHARLIATAAPARPQPGCVAEHAAPQGRSLRRFRATVGLSIVATLLSGCFSGDYNRRMETTIQQLAELGALAAVIYPQTSPVQDGAGNATGISLRLPRLVGGAAAALTADQADAQPPLLSLPGLAYAYEIEQDGEKVYVYFAAVSVEEQAADVLMQELQAALSKLYSSAAWRDTALKTPDGGSVRVSVMSVTGMQRFGASSQEGRFDLYMVSSPTHHVLVGWRAPTSSPRGQEFFRHAAISMGSVTGGT